MPKTKISFALLLIVPVAFAQRGGGGAHAGGMGVAHGGPTHSASVVNARVANRVSYRAGDRYGSRGRFGYGLGYGWPYAPIWDYGAATPLYYDDESAGEYPFGYLPTEDFASYPAVGPGHARPANSVLHEYNFPEQPSAAAGTKSTFTIVLRDGSTRSAVASWVTGGRLHYIDPDSKQQVLAATLIDRKATEEANAAKNLNLTLPPG